MIPYIKKSNNKAFSLLEMSISLTVIAMLIAAVLTGQSMKHQAELNQVITDISTITSAVKQFKDTYSNVLPGDLSTATSSLGSTTTNGDGNGYLTNSSEELFFWQHLQLAGLISGTYDGATTGAGGLMATSQKYGYYQAHKSDGGRLNIQVSKADGGGLFSTKEAYDFDRKYDDGNPGFTDPVTTSATIAAADGSDASSTACVTTSTSPDEYTLSVLNGTPCILYFYLE